MVDEGFSDWFKENIPEKGLPENVTFTKQFLLDAWHNGYVCGCIEEKEQLAKAKEIIKGLLELGSIGDGDYTYVREAEQFLSEVKE